MTTPTEPDVSYLTDLIESFTRHGLPMKALDLIYFTDRERRFLTEAFAEREQQRFIAAVLAL
jgi:hypothetical protein